METECSLPCSQEVITWHVTGQVSMFPHLLPSHRNILRAQHENVLYISMFQITSSNPAVSARPQLLADLGLQRFDDKAEGPETWINTFCKCLVIDHDDSHNPGNNSVLCYPLISISDFQLTTVQLATPTKIPFACLKVRPPPSWITTPHQL
jgi:hypothetical protein